MNILAKSADECMSYRIEICPICKHPLKSHYLKPNGKLWWGWERNKYGKKVRWCACRECEEYDAIYS